MQYMLNVVGLQVLYTTKICIFQKASQAYVYYSNNRYTQATVNCVWKITAMTSPRFYRPSIQLRCPPTPSASSGNVKTKREVTQQMLFMRHCNATLTHKVSNWCNGFTYICTWANARARKHIRTHKLISRYEVN